MTILIFIAVCSLAGELVAGLFAGGSCTRRNIFLWSAGAILWSIISGGILIFQKDQLEADQGEGNVVSLGFFHPHASDDDLDPE